MHQFNTSNNVKIVDTSLVNKILEQGQKLRNAMVESILKNDPFNADIIYSKHFNSPKTSDSDFNDNRNACPVTHIDEKRLEAYIKGDYMTKCEEKLALDTLRSLSAPDLYKTTEKSLNSTCLGTCRCYTCELYNTNDLYCDLRRNNEIVDSINRHPGEDVTRDIQEKYRNENENLLKYADSLKVSINNLTLNETGNRKIFESDKKVPYNHNETYFLEYHLPDCIISKCTVSKSKVNSGLENNYVRFCSRRSYDGVNFKQVTIHDVKNLDKCNLDECEIKFKISYRLQKQKRASTLGFATFNLGFFLLSKSLVCNRNLSVFLDEKSPINVGNLKVSVSLGCGKLYFGQEFVDAISTVKSKSVPLDDDDSTNELNGNEPNYKALSEDFDGIKRPTRNESNHHESRNVVVGENNLKKSVSVSRTNKNCETDDVFPKSDISKSKQTGKIEINTTTAHVSKNVLEQRKNIDKKITSDSKDYGDLKPQISEKEKQILFGFLYISEVQYLSRPVSTYVTCRPFCQSETSCSKLVTDTSSPVFNFAQLIPLLYEDELLQLLRENYMVIEFWKKIGSSELAFGLTKVSLHQFYLAYRNPVFVKYLAKNKLPIIDTDWWEPIYSIDTENIIGQVQVLVALGTEDQINNLKSERGFTINNVKAKFPVPRLDRNLKPTEKFNVPEHLYSDKAKHEVDFLQLKKKFKPNVKILETEKLDESKDKIFYSKFKEKDKHSHCTDKAINTSLSPRKVITPLVQKFDVGTQSTLEMDNTTPSQDKDKVSPTQEMLGSFLSQLMAQRQKNIFVENSTNTEEVDMEKSNCSRSLQDAQSNTNLKLRKTTDLLDSLQKALSLDGPSNIRSSIKRAGTFTASITIHSANHLPSRKKCKSRRSRNRSIKNDDNVLPSCYVTFETSENHLKTTPVVARSTNPTWNYKCVENLSDDLLTNSQRRLIFKVWRKATNTVVSPNMQTDIVLGFAAVDLTVLLAGFPNVNGWFNIIDFTGKCNGQINIHIAPLEDLSQYSLQKQECGCNTASGVAKPDTIEPEEHPSGVFSRALKRKFTELDEITQRLRLRLSKVTNEDSDSASDGIAEEFERDINSLCVEEDFDLIDFEEESKNLNFNHNSKENSAGNESGKGSKLQQLLTIQETSSNSKGDEDMRIACDSKASGSNTATSLSQDAGSLLTLGSSSDKERELATLDKHLQDGKQKIDALLEKLSLISTETSNTFASRYVSGCSLNNDHNAVNIDTEAILKELDHHSRPNIQSSLGFEPLKFQQLYGESVDSNSAKVDSGATTNSDTSLITNYSDCRLAPDGQGNTSEERVVQK